MAAQDQQPSGTAHAFRRTADLVELLETTGVRVSECDPVTWPETLEDDYVTVSLTVGVPLQTELAAAGAATSDPIRRHPAAVLPAAATSGPLRESGSMPMADADQSDATTVDEREPTERLVDHLLDETADGPIEQSASDIGEAIDLSGSKVAGNLRTLDDDRLTVEKRDRNGLAALWHVERSTNDDSEPPGSIPDLPPAVTPLDEDEWSPLADSDSEPATATTDGGTAVQTASSESPRESKADILQEIRDHIGMADHARGCSTEPTKSDLQAICQFLEVGGPKVVLLNKRELRQQVRDGLALEQSGPFHKSDLQEVRDVLLETEPAAERDDHTPAWEKLAGGEKA